MTDSSAEINGPFEFITFEPCSRNLEPIFVEEDFAVYEKPSGLLIHPQNRYTPYSLVDEIKYRFGKDANIVHRIDQETSGLVLAARNKVAERTLKIMFQERNVQKEYLALVHGHFQASTTVDIPLTRLGDESAVVRMLVKADPSGKPSQTSLCPIRYFKELDATLIRAIPYTGRQHQIRVHLFHMKHPIVGDPIYGQSSEQIVKYLDRLLLEDERIRLTGANRLLLHADFLRFSYKNQDFIIQSKRDFAAEAIAAHYAVCGTLA